MRLTDKRRIVGYLVTLALLTGPAMPASGAGADRDELMRFALEMAEGGNWREARFRWERALALSPDDPRLLNNLAVAREALGDSAEAIATYRQARGLSGEGPLADNAVRAERFWKGVLGDAPPAVSPAPRKKGGGDAVRILVKLPVPAKLDLSGTQTLLVASFLARETDLLDVNRELARFFRGEFRKHSSLRVLEVVPPPAIPEQSLEDLAANREFWKELGREHGAGLILSGRIVYDRRDSSGFQEVEEISPVTGQKVRDTRFVEQERFTYAVDLLFLDGTSGDLRFKDRIERSLTFAGQANDPITAFYTLSETVAGDALAVVAPRPRQDERWLYRN